MSNKEGGSPKQQTKTNFAIAGGLSSIFTRCLCQPLDVIKIRFQLQIEPISKKHEDSKYHGFCQALKLIRKEEGVFGFWRGHVAAQLLSIIYGIVQFQVYELLKIEASQIRSKDNIRLEKYPSVHFFAGGLAGSLATCCSFPFDIVRTRQIAQGNNKHYRGVLHGLTEIYAKEGVLAYWRGLTPALIVVGPFIGFQFTFYELTKRAVVYLDWYGVTVDKNETNALGNFVSGSVAGVMAKAITYPFDLIRRRMQIQNFQYARIGFGENFSCSGVMSCFHGIRKREGVFGLYKGLMPSIIKSSLTAALSFMFYAESLKIINKYR